MRRFLAALIAAALAAAALFVPAASARPRITLRYTAVLDLKTVRVNVEPLRDTDVLDEKSAHVDLESEAISFGALLYVPRGIAGSARFSVRNGRGDSVVFGAPALPRRHGDRAGGNRQPHPGPPPPRHRGHAAFPGSAG